jgi:hypothetical protein
MKWFLPIAALLVLSASRVQGQTNAAAAPPAAPSPTAGPRVAIVTTPETTDLAAALATELAGHPNLAVVPASGAAQAGTPPTTAPSVGADGLVFLSKDSSAIHVRFTAVGTGSVVFDLQPDPTLPVSQIAHTSALRVADDAAKLRRDRKPSITVSVLNLHADYNTPDSAELERKLTTLLESRLAALPGVLLLERRHAWAEGRERALSSAPKPILTATYVIDGGISPPMSAGGEASVHLNLRPATGPPTALDVQGSATDPAALVDKMAAEIQKALGTAPAGAAWPATQEAREFLKEGIWGYQHNREDVALDALDSAELLGETAPDLLAARIPVLCRRIVGTPGANVYYNGEPVPDDPQPEAKIAAFQRAMADSSAYEKSGGEGKLQILDHTRSMDGRTWDLHKAVDREGGFLLVMLDRTKQPQADDVRAALRAFMTYDPLHGKLPGDWESAIDFADNLANSKEEELAYYKGIMTTQPFADFGARRLMWQLQPENFCARFLPEADRSAAFTTLFQDLSHDPVAAPLALYMLASRAPPDQKDAACHALYQYLWDEREKYPTGDHLTYNLESAWKLEQSRRVKEADPLLVKLLHYYLQHDNAFTGLESEMWLPDLFPAAEAPSLLADLQAYEKRDPKAEEHLVYRQMEQAYYDHFGGDSKAEPSLPALGVTRFWYPKDAPRRLILGMGAITPVPGGLWLAGELDGDNATQTPEQGLLYHIGLDPTKPDCFVDPPAPVVALHPYMRNLVSMPEGLYALSSTSDQPPKTVIDHYNPATKQWDEGEVPGADELYTAAGHLYFSLKGIDFANREGGLARYDGKTGDGAMLASSRRRPAQNQLDDCADYHVDDIFTGPDNKPCVLANWKFYYISETPGPWESMLPDLLPMHGKSQAALTVLFGPCIHKPPGDTVIVIDPAKPDPELWLGPLTPRPVPGGTVPGTPPPPPAWAATAIWQQPKDGIQASDFGLRGDDLFAFIAGGPKSTKLELVWFQRGKPEPVHIPLQFKMSNDAKAALATVIPATVNTYGMVSEPNKSPYGLSMTVLPEGICFKSIIQGFWFIPFGDIDAWLKKNAAATPLVAPASAVPATSPPSDKPPAPSAAKSPPHGDTIDAGTPNSFE